MTSTRAMENKVAIVTGSTRGIGRAIADRLSSAGVNVVYNGRDEQSLSAAVDAAATKAVGVRGSVSDPELPERLVQTAVDSFGSAPTLLVNNAAVSASYGPLLDVERSAFEKTMLANTWPALSLVQTAVAAGMSSGSVVNISTTGAQRVHPVTGPYCASKAALESLTTTLARELGPRGIRVNAVAPGLVRTDLAKVLWEGQRGTDEQKLVPLQRLGEPDDIAAAACFLLGDESSWINGTVVRVDGGRFTVGGEPADLIGVY